ncbi:hypothetical protein SteCoe_16900 [Stentor coeruleus]|uniref:Uncharacterized protein n=1 Tax=Stentor coeruleus TaxID=5963 RepID=A0A1R2C090_9CILI|nr:hypothetical protein SteCoe_16900 [Stentor coeruleus]
MSSNTKQISLAEKSPQETRKIYKKKIRLALNTTIEFPDSSLQKLPQIKLTSLSPYAIQPTKSYKNLEESKIKPMISVNKKQVINYDQKRNDKKLFYSHSLVSSKGENYIEKNNTNFDRVCEMMKSIEGNNDMQKRLEVYGEVIEEVIDKNQAFGGVLKILKSGYEQVIITQSIVLKSQSRQILEMENLKNELSFNIEKLIEKNKDLSNQIKDIQRKYNEISTKYLKIADTNFQLITRKDNNFNEYVKENKNTEEMIKKQNTEIRHYKIRAKKMMELILALEKKGYPVEKVYNSEVKKYKKLDKGIEDINFHNDLKELENLNEKSFKIDISNEIAFISAGVDAENCTFISDSETELFLSLISIKDS